MSALLELLRKAESGDKAAQRKLIREMNRIDWSPDREFRLALAESIRRGPYGSLSRRKQENE